MIRKYLLNLSVGSEPDYSDNNTREKVGLLAGMVGVVINLILFTSKLIIGILLSSIAVTADAFNNLSDAASSIISIIGFKLSNLAPDKEHPYGHGRIEYISALIIAFMVILVGFQFVKSSLSKIIRPEVIVFQKLPFFILLISIIFKVWLSLFNRDLGEKIDSSSLRATATDAMGDVFTTSVVLLSLLASLFTDFPIDGYIGILVALMIIYSGLSLVKETISPLIGEAPDEELIEAIKDGVLKKEYITGVHDLVVHNYGPGRTMATIHAEFPATVNVLDIHEVIDSAEREISKELNIDLVIHMDPVCMDTSEIIESRKKIRKLLSNYSYIKSFHDFRMIGKDNKKTFVFDIIVDGNKLDESISDEDIKNSIMADLKAINPGYKCNIKIDREFI